MRPSPKKQKKKANPYAKSNALRRRENTLTKDKELGLIIAAHTYIGMELQNTAHNGVSSEEATLGKTIVSKLGTVITTHKPMKDRSARLFHDVIIKMDDDIKVSAFCVGIELLAWHNEVSDKDINVGLGNQIIELQDLLYDGFKPEVTRGASKYAEDIYKMLKAS